MKINISDIDSTQFSIKHGEIAGDDCVLVTPKSLSCAWTKENMIFRSSIWNASGEPVSLGFKKFFMFSEHPELDYTPFSLNANGGCDVIEKIDGSLLCVTRYKGQIIHRTRGTFNATTLTNGGEIEFLKEKYPKVFIANDDPAKNSTWGLTYLYEWTTPSNRIIIDPGPEPRLFLVGAVVHKDYSYISQSDLDDAANAFGVERPKRYSYNSVKEMLNAVEAFENKEGVCIYSNHGQSIRKAKGIKYLSLHHMKSEMGSMDRVIDLYFVLECPSYNDFYNYIASTFDFEIAEYSKGFVSGVCDAMKKVGNIIEGMKVFVERFKRNAQGNFKENRKRFAEAVFKSYGGEGNNRSGMVFSIWDCGELSRDQVKKLLYQTIKQ